jgi:hypothetical protein
MQAAKVPRKPKFKRVSLGPTLRWLAVEASGSGSWFWVGMRTVGGGAISLGVVFA